MKRQLLIILFAMLMTNINSYGQGSCCNYNSTGQHPGINSATFGIALGDIDNDGDNDAVTVDAYVDMEVYINDGTGNFTFDRTYGSSKDWFGVDLVDVDNDNDLDIIVAAFYSGDGCEIWVNDGAGNFTFSQGGIASNISMRKLGIGDLDGDGSPDIFAPAYSGSSSQVWLNNGEGTFTNTNQSLSGSSCTQAVLADFDGDNDLDAFVSRTNGASNNVWINNGSGIFSNSGLDLGTSSSYGVGASDVDGDGDIDAIAANWQTPSQVWLNDGNANFTEGTQINNNNYAKAIEISDIDYDCDDDVIIGSYGSYGVQVWTNDGAGNFNLCFENSVGGSVYAHDIAVADLNNDLMPDIWAGNFSSSTGDYIYLKSTPVIVYDTLNLCIGDSLMVGCDWRTGTGDYLEAINCDTLSWYHILETFSDTSVTLISDTLFASPNYIAYQWFNCETMVAIAGATQYYFAPDTSGSYAVEITSETCVDTSYCHWVQIPSAYFEGDPTSGDVPLNVAFTDLSTGVVSTWDWDFGDGNTSTDQNPNNNYTSPGWYTVSLIISGPGGADTLIKTDYIHSEYLSPIADFVGTPTSGIAPLEVVFTDLSADSVDSWNWNFGDGETSYEQSPTHNYLNPGVYTVSLTVGGPGGANEMTKTDYINANFPEPTADFVGTPTSGNTPLLVNFTDLSADSVNTWLWSFGDGETSDLQNPDHTYGDVGVYSVTLNVEGPGGSNEMTKTDYIEVTANAPVADFEGTPTFGEAPLMVTFTDLSTGTIDSWLWNFGDGDTSNVQNPQHEYITPGNFTVSLTAAGTGGSDTEVKTDYILIPVGINENTKENIIAYPNPVTNKLNIILPDATDRVISIKNIEGKLLKKFNTSTKEVIIDMSKFTQGIYSLIIEAKDGATQTIKLIKK